MNSFLSSRYSQGVLYYIKKCIKEGLDPSLFKLADYNEEQACEIYYGLKANLEVQKYASPLFSAIQMKNIREGLLLGLDVSLYADKKYNDGQMKAIKESLIYNTYMEEYATCKVSEHNILLYNKMQLEGYDKKFLKTLAQNGVSNECLKVVRRINQIFGNKYNKLFETYKIKDDIAKDLFKILFQFPELCDERLFKIFTSEIARKNSNGRLIRKAIEMGAPISLCESFVNLEISQEVFITKSNKYLEDSIIRDYELETMSKELKVNIKEEYPAEVLDKSISLKLDLQNLIAKGYDFEQLEEINCAYEDKIHNFLDLINPSMSSKDMFLVRNNIIIDRHLRNLKGKHKKLHKDFFGFFTVSYDKGYWYIKDKDEKIFFKNNDIDILLDKIKYLYEFLTQGLTTEEILLIIEENKE